MWMNQLKLYETLLKYFRCLCHTCPNASNSTKFISSFNLETPREVGDLSEPVQSRTKKRKKNILGFKKAILNYSIA